MRDPEKRRAYQRQYQKRRRASDQEYLEKQRAFVRAYSKKKYDGDPEYRTKRNKLRNISKYRITIEEYDSMLEKQAGGCAICRKAQANKAGHRLHIDHCHRSGAVRGLLCSSCNILLGLAGDSIERLLDCISYLRNRDNV